MRKKNLLMEYDRNWEKLFKEEKSRIIPLIKEYRLSIWHIGSTSVEGLWARPTIDIAVGARRTLFRREDVIYHIMSALISLGYKYDSDYEKENGGCKFFEKSSDEEVKFNIYLMEYKNINWKKKIFFRDFLAGNTRKSNDYSDLKKEILLSTQPDLEEYNREKNNFIEGIFKKYYEDYLREEREKTAFTIYKKSNKNSRENL